MEEGLDNITGTIKAGSSESEVKKRVNLIKEKI